MSSERFGPLQQLQQQQQQQQQQPNKKELHSQIGFYLLPPEPGSGVEAEKTASKSKRRTKKSQASNSKPQGPPVTTLPLIVLKLESINYWHQTHILGGLTMLRLKIKNLQQKSY